MQRKTFAGGARFLVLALCGAVFISFGIGQNSDLEKCRKGDAAACERLGFSKEVAKQLAKYLKKGDSQIWQTQNQELLWAIGKTSEYGSDRRKALERLTDQVYLLELILLSDSGSPTEEQALAKISDPDMLARVVRSSPHETLRSNALEMLDDPRCLTELALEWRENERRTNTWLIDKIVGKLNDPLSIARLATTAVPDHTRCLAVRKLEDQSILLQVAAGDTSKWVRIAAVERVTDQPFLARLALSDPEPDIRKAAVARVTDQAVLKTILDKETDREIRQAAARNMTDERLLADLILAEKLEYTAVSSITSQELLREIALKSKREYARSSAVGRIDDQSFLQQVVLNDPDEFVRCEALNRITDKQFLMQVLKTRTPCNPVSKIVLDRLNDQALLGELSTAAADVSVRRAAVERLTDRQKLAALAEGGTDVKRSAQQRLEHFDLLAELQSLEIRIHSPQLAAQEPFNRFVREMEEVQPGTFRSSGQLGYRLKDETVMFTPHRYTAAVFKRTGTSIRGPSEPDIREAYLARVIVGGSKHTAIAAFTENAHYYFLVMVECYFLRSNRTERSFDGCPFPDTVPVSCEPVYLEQDVFRLISEDTGEGVEEAYSSNGYVARQKGKAFQDSGGNWTWKIKAE
jgi:hypothetical protein